MSEVGPGKPPVEHQFKKGQSGNPGGMTAEQRKRIADNAEKAAKLQSAMLDAMLAKAFDPETGEMLKGDEALQMIAADPQRFLKEAMDRGFGTATQSVDHRSGDGSMSPSNESRDAAIEAMRRKHGDA